MSKKPLKLMQGIALTALGSTLVILLNIYMPTYLKLNLSYSASEVSLFQLMNTIILSIAVLLFGVLSDTLGWRKTVLTACIALLLLSYPCYKLLSINIDTAYFATFILVILSAAIISSYTAILSQLFDTSVRYTGVSLSFNIGFALFGGTTPFIATTFIHQTHNTISPVFYLLFITFLGLLATLKLPIRPAL